MAQRQLNVRVDAATFDALEAAAFVEGISLPDVIRPHIETFARALAQEGPVQNALRAREEYRAFNTGKLSVLRSRRVGAEGSEE
jgi:hypothetical protein